MMKLFNLLVFAALLYCACSDGKAVPGTSYIDSIKLFYEDGIWHCDRLTCPKSRTLGCRILRTNDVNDKQVLVRTNICLGENNTAIATIWMSGIMYPVKTVDINITSFVGAESAYMTGYSRSIQNVKGIVAADDWENVQQATRDNMNAVDESEWDQKNFTLYSSLENVKY